MECYVFDRYVIGIHLVSGALKTLVLFPRKAVVALAS